MNRPVLVDLCCGAGGCSEGYRRAGFDVVGVDLTFSPRYHFPFILADALNAPIDWERVDAVHASPPCQAFSVTSAIWDRGHADLLTPMREQLNALGKPWVIENVPGAPMNANLILCGTMFGLNWRGHQIFRHRLFEAGGGFNLSPFVPMTCNHDSIPLSVFGHSGELRIGERRMEGGSMRRKALRVTHAQASEAMGIDWMTRLELSQAIPPAYTEFIGRQLMRTIGR